MSPVQETMPQLIESETSVDLTTVNAPATTTTEQESSETQVSSSLKIVRIINVF